jgi:hypothetical protein
MAIKHLHLLEQYALGPWIWFPRNDANFLNWWGWTQFHTVSWSCMKYSSANQELKKELLQSIQNNQGKLVPNSTQSSRSYTRYILQYVTHFSPRFPMLSHTRYSEVTPVVTWQALSVFPSIVFHLALLFQCISSFQQHYGPGTGSVSNRNEYQEIFLEGRGRAARKADNFVTICERTA